MKKILILLLGIILLTGCAKDDKAEVVPAAPENLTGEVISTSAIDLMWTDRSTNETGFKIERKTGTGIYAVVGATVTDITSFNDANLTPGTTYTYRIYSNNNVGNSLTYSNELTLTTASVINPPTITTKAVSSITTTTATSGGTISSDGGAPIIARGVCWSTIANPTIYLATKTNDGLGSGEFISNIAGLKANTTYYLRAYATNSSGTTYGNDVSFSTLQNSTSLNVAGPNVTDIDGKTYQSVTNCGITFTKQNLNVSKYTDGTPIPQVTNPTQWQNLTTGAWCYYENNTANGGVYGKLYNWYAVMGIYDAASLANTSLRKKLAPSGWHIPSTDEWATLTDCLGGVFNAGGNMKEVGVSHWTSPNISATNSSGFTALPGGSFSYLGYSSGLGLFVSWWSSTEGGDSGAWRKTISNASSSFGGNVDPKISGISVRCLKD